MKNIFLLFALSAFVFPLAANAAEPQIWSVDTRAEVLRGESKGVSVTDAGAITLAPRLTQIFNAEQPFVWSSAADANGNVYLGTGGDGKIFKVDASGKGALLYDTNELNVAALAVGKSGEIYAGTAPDGRVYKISPDGGAAVFFEPKEKYIWSLAVLSDGSLAVGTGENGKIYRVRTEGAKPENSLLFDSSEMHIISLAADARGNLYAGTDASGLVLRFAPDGKPFALLDSALREIHDLAVGADGSVYALALSDSASAQQKPTAATGTGADGGSVSATITSTESAAPTESAAQKSRYDLSAAKSAVYRILPDGGSDIVWNSSSVTAFSIAAAANGVLLGTSDKGRVYSVTNDGRETLLLQSGEGQISTLKNAGNQIYATSSNQGKLYRFGAETEREGTYESTVLDAKASASWGRIWWRSGGNVALQTRSGNTQTPNETWSDWSAAYTNSTGAQITSPKAKYLQWRAVFKTQANNFVSSLDEVNVSYLPRNIAPEVLSIQILPANVGLVANPPLQIDPNIESSGLDPSVFGFPNAPIAPRKVYQRGARALQWTAEDRNGDKLEYDVYFRETNEATFKLLRENQRESFLTLDGSALSDGRYIFRVVAKDAPSNPSDVSLAGERLSEAVDFDNTPPTISALAAPQITADRARVSFEAADAASYLVRAEYSVDGGDWQEVFADDGISDNRAERYTIEIPLKAAGEYTITLRVFDVNGNVGSARVLARK